MKKFILVLTLLVAATICYGDVKITDISLSTVAPEDSLVTLLRNKFAQVNVDVDAVSGLSNKGTGDWYYVDSAVGSDTYDGTTWAWAKATIGGAEAECTANNGDVIFVAQGHAENIATYAALHTNCAGIIICGLGNGDDMPEVSLTTAASAIRVSAADIVWYNIRFLGAYTGGVAECFDVNDEGDGLVVIGCEFKETSINMELLIGIALEADADRCTIANTRFINFVSGDATSAIYQEGGSDKTIYRDNTFIGDWSGYVIDGMTALSTGLLIENNKIFNVDTTAGKTMAFHSSTGGSVINNKCYGAHASTHAFVGDAMFVSPDNVFMGVVNVETRNYASSLGAYTGDLGTNAGDSILQDFILAQTDLDAALVHLVDVNTTIEIMEVHLEDMNTADEARDVWLTDANTADEARDVWLTDMNTADEARDVQLTDMNTLGIAQDVVIDAMQVDIDDMNTLGVAQDVFLTDMNTADEARDVQLTDMNTLGVARDVVIDAMQVDIDDMNTLGVAQDVFLTDMNTADEARDVQLTDMNTLGIAQDVVIDAMQVDVDDMNTLRIAEQLIVVTHLTDMNTLGVAQDVVIDAMQVDIDDMNTLGIAQDVVIDAMQVDIDDMNALRIAEQAIMVTHVVDMNTQDVARDVVIDAMQVDIDDMNTLGIAQDVVIDAMQVDIDDMNTLGVAQDVHLVDMNTIFVSDLPSMEIASVADMAGYDDIAWFTVTGDVMVRCVGVVGGTPITTTGGASTLSIGTTEDVDDIIAATTMDNADFAATDVWVDNNPEDDCGTMDGAVNTWHIIGGGADIFLTRSVDDILGGVLTIYCWWKPLSSGATVVAAF